jgi:hypothetical protein
LLVVAAIVVASCLPARAQEASARVLSERTVTVPMRVLKDGQAVKPEMRNATVDIRSTDGKNTKANVLVIREPQSGAYWWTYQETLAGGSEEQPAWDHTVFYTGDKAVGFNFSRPYLEVREIQGRQPSLDAAQQAAVADLQKNIRAIHDGAAPWGREISVAGKLGRDFLSVKDSAAFFPQPKVTAVKRAARGWEVTLEGPNRDTAVLVLDDQYQITAVRRAPENK